MKKKLPLTSAFLLIIVGLYFFINIYLADNFVFGSILLVSATISMYLIIKIWRRFTPKYAPKIIYWTSSQKYARKIIAGGSFSYYEYKEDIEKIGFFEPVSRFINLMIAFLGLSTTIAKIINFIPESPVQDLVSMLGWALLLIIVPIILTPIIPIIWTMEDLGLKAWNKKTLENWRISIRYKRRFNSFIAVGALTAGLGLTSEANGGFFDNALVFLGIVGRGVLLLIYPIGILTLLYYLQFRGIVNREVRAVMDIPTAKTILDIVDPLTGLSIIDENVSTENVLGLKVSEKNAIKIMQDEKQQQLEVVENEEEGTETGENNDTIFTKIGSSTKKSIDTVNKATFGRISKLIKTTKKKKSTKKRIEPDTKTKKKQFTGGSATAGLWDREEKED